MDKRWTFATLTSQEHGIWRPNRGRAPHAGQWPVGSRSGTTANQAAESGCMELNTRRPGGGGTAIRPDRGRGCSSSGYPGHHKARTHPEGL